MISTIEGRCNRCEKRSANCSVFGWMTRNLPTPDTKAIARENRERMFPDYLCNHCQKLARWRTYFSQKVQCHPGTMNGDNKKRLRSICVENILRDRANGSSLVLVDGTNFNLYCPRKEADRRLDVEQP